MTFQPTRPFSGFSVDDIPAAKQFYGDTLGLPVSELNGMLMLDIGAGAEVLHEPRVWPEYHPNYYGAFVRDPDGNNVEAVCHLPE